MSAIAQCLSFSFLLALSTLSDLTIPISYNFNYNYTDITIADLKCPTIAGGKTWVYYNTSGVSIEVEEAMNVTCQLEMTLNSTENVDLIFALTSQAGEALTVATVPDPNMTCYAGEATLAKATLAPTISQLRISPANSELDGLLAGLAFFGNIIIAEMIQGIGKDLTTQITNHTELPLNPFPPLRPGALPVQQWSLGTAIVNIIEALPVLMGAKITVDEPSETGLELNITMQEALVVNSSTAQVYIPKDVVLSVDLGFDLLICNDAGFDCVISNGPKLPNIRTYGGGQMDLLMNNFISPLLSKLVDSAFANGLTLNIHVDSVSQDPPTWLVLLMGPLCSILAVSAVAYSVHRHIMNPVCDIHGKPISLRRVLVEDVFVTSVCFVCIFLFAHSNATPAGASVMVGNEMAVYTFSLGNSIHDMWAAGLYPLSILIAIFSGIYPYIKLLTIVTFSVILQQPQNKFLRLVDNIGKFSLLDSFVVIILTSGLEVKGIATVKSQVSFDIFVVATIGSIFIGNYATHGWRHQTTVRYNDDERANQIRRISANSRISKMDIEEGGSKKTVGHIGVTGFSANSPSAMELGSGGRGSGSGGGYDSGFLTNHLHTAENRLLDGSKGLEGIESLKLKWYEIWEWQLAIPAALIVAGITIACCYLTNLTYHITGFATMVTGTSKSVSIWDLFAACNPLLLCVGFFTVVFAPFAYVVTYPHCRFLAAWASTDVFLLSCVAGLLQLKQIITFVLGGSMAGLYSATCSLEWPLMLWIASMVVQWFFIFKQTLGIPGIPTIRKIQLAMTIRDDDTTADADDN